MCGFLFMSLGIAGTHAQDTTAIPHWSPDRALDKQLGKPAKVGEYTLQPPRNYSMRKMDATNAPKGIWGFAWLGAGRKDGTHPTLILSLIAAPEGAAQKYTPDKLAERLVEGVKRRRTDWQQDKTEQGIVNNLTFARIRWTAIEPSLNREMQGFLYAALDGNTIIQVTSQDVLPDAKQTLALAEAAVLTFKRQTQGKD